MPVLRHQLKFYAFLLEVDALMAYGYQYSGLVCLLAQPLGREIMGKVDTLW